jgi:hypothetical protein
MLNRIAAEPAHCNAGLRRVIEAAGLINHFMILPAKAMHDGDSSLPLLAFDKFFNGLGRINLGRR